MLMRRHREEENIEDVVTEDYVDSTEEDILEGVITEEIEETEVEEKIKSSRRKKGTKKADKDGK